MGCFSPEVEKTERDIGKETRDSLQAQIDLAPDVYATEREYKPLYTDLSMDVLRQTLLGGRETQQYFDPTAGEWRELKPGTDAPIIGGPETRTRTTGTTPADWQRTGRAGGGKSIYTNPATGETVESFGPPPASEGGTVHEYMDDSGNWVQYDPDAGTLPGQRRADTRTHTEEGEGILNLLQEAYPIVGEIESDARTQSRTADIEDVENLGRRATEAFYSANPRLAAQMERLEGLSAGFEPTALEASITADALNPTAPASVTELASRARGVGEDSITGLLRDEAAGAGPSPIRAEMTRQAMDELALGRQLSPEEARDAEQQARAAYNDRGLVRSNRAVASEILNRDSVARQREAQRRGFASGVEGLLQTDQANTRNFQLGAQRAGLADRGQQFNILGTAAGTEQRQQAADRQYAMQAEQMAQQRMANQRAYEGALAGMYEGQASDPFLTVLGRASTTGGAAAGALSGAGFTQGAGNTLFGMTQGQHANYASNLNSQNASLANQANMYNANAQADMMGGIFGLGTGLLGGFL